MFKLWDCLRVGQYLLVASTCFFVGFLFWLYGDGPGGVNDIATRFCMFSVQGENACKLAIGTLLFAMVMVPFFLAYTVVYPYRISSAKHRNNKELSGDARDRGYVMLGAGQKRTFVGLYLLCAFLSILGFASLDFSIHFMTGYAVLFLMSGFSTYNIARHFNSRNASLVANELIWPTMFTVGVSMYYGFYVGWGFGGESSWFSLIFPLLGFLSYYFLMFRYSLTLSKATKGTFRNWFHLLGAVLLIAGVALSKWIQAFEFFDYFLIFVVFAAHSGILEAWRVTLRHAERGDAPKKEEYTVATNMLLLSSAIVVIFAFNFSSFSHIFYLLYVILISSVATYWMVVQKYSLKPNHFTLIKIAFFMASVLVLIIGVLLGDALFPRVSLFVENAFRSASAWALSIVAGMPLASIAVYMIRFYFIKRDISEANAQKFGANRGLSGFLHAVFFVHVHCAPSVFAQHFINSMLTFAFISGFVSLFLLIAGHESASYFFCGGVAYIAISLIIPLSFIFDKTTDDAMRSYENWRNELEFEDSGEGSLSKNALKHHSAEKSGFTKKCSALAKMLHLPSVAMLYLLVFFASASYSSSDFAITLFRPAPFVLAAAGAFALNDYFDYEKDAINKPYRALPMHIFSLRFARNLGTALIVASVVSIIPFIFVDWVDCLLYLTASIGAVCYSVFLNKLSFVKSLVTALVLLCPFIMITKNAAINIDLVAFWIASGLSVISKEILMDVYDYEGDKAQGFKTVAVVLGKKWTEKLSIAFFFVALLIFSISYRSVELSVPLLPISLGFGMVAYFIWFVAGRKQKRLAMLSLWAPLVLYSLPIMAGWA